MSDRAKMSLCSDCGHSGTILKGDATRVWFVLCCGCGKQVFGDATGQGSAKAKWNEVNIPVVKPCLERRLSQSQEVELVIIRGLPGSGKSTLAKTAFADHLHYEPDHLFSDTNGRYLFDAQLFDKAKDFVLSMTDYALSRGESVVVSDVFPKIDELKPYVDLANYHDVSIRVIYTSADYGNVHRVPKYVLDEMLQAYEANEPEAYERIGIKADSVSSDVYFLVGQ